LHSISKKKALFHLGVVGSKKKGTYLDLFWKHSHFQSRRLFEASNVQHHPNREKKNTMEVDDLRLQAQLSLKVGYWA